MPVEPARDWTEAHRYFSAECFNRAWDLIDKTDRSPVDDLQMMARSAASLWHWSQRPDCTPRNLSIAYWQLARVFAILGHGELAKQFGEQSRDAAPADDWFCRAYAYESLARAAKVQNDRVAFDRYVEEAKKLAASVEDRQDQELIMSDINQLTTWTG